MKKFEIKIKSIFSNIVWYWNKEGETFTASKEQTINLFWGPGEVFVTEHGNVHISDAEIVSEEESVNALQDN